MDAHLSSPASLAEKVRAAVKSVPVLSHWGTATAITRSTLRIAGLAPFAKVGDLVHRGDGQSFIGEIIALTAAEATVMRFDGGGDLTIGDRLYLGAEDCIYPSESWFGRVLDAYGRDLKTGEKHNGPLPAPLNAKPPPAAARKTLGPRLYSGLKAFNTLLPICHGQRLGLFAAAGLGKSTLMADLARTVEADVAIIALIGERGREVAEFSAKALSGDHDPAPILFAATSDAPAAVKRRTAFAAMATAEHFRRAGAHVLLLFDSLTRFADAHREIALSAGEPPSFRAYPPSLAPAIAALAERAGPGGPDEGDITALFTVLVSGDDHNEPVADVTRGILDGHIVLAKTIAERGRFPAIDALKSVSRSLPHAATAPENTMISEARALIAAYEEAEPMIRAGLYTAGADAAADRAVALWPQLDAFVGAPSAGSVEEDFASLEKLIRPADDQHA